MGYITSIEEGRVHLILSVLSMITHKGFGVTLGEVTIAGKKPKIADEFDVYSVFGKKIAPSVLQGCIFECGDMMHPLEKQYDMSLIHAMNSKDARANYYKEYRQLDLTMKKERCAMRLVLFLDKNAKQQLGIAVKVFSLNSYRLYDLTGYPVNTLDFKFVDEDEKRSAMIIGYAQNKAGYDGHSGKVKGLWNVNIFEQIKALRL